VSSKEYNARYRALHRSELIAKQKQYYAEHRDEINAKGRQHQAEYRLLHREEAQKYRSEHRGETAAYDKEYRAKYRDKIKARQKQWEAEHSNEIRVHAKQYRAEHSDEIRARDRKKSTALRQKCLAAYGRKCVCCGESIERFLTIDHANGDGAKHRKTIPGAKICRWLIKNDFPEGFQVLCYNCNMGKQLNGGVCPHKEAGGESTFPLVPVSIWETKC